MRSRFYMALCGVLVTAASPAYADQIRENFDTAGNLLSRLTYDGSELREELTIKYDATGKPIEKRTIKGGKTTIETTTYDGALVTQVEVLEDGKLVNRKKFTYDHKKVATITEENGAGAITTTAYTYDLFGNPMLVETKDAAGIVQSRKESTFQRPLVPIVFEFVGGGSYNSDVPTTDVVFGLNISRKPSLQAYGSDPLEVRFATAFKFTQGAFDPVLGERILVNNQLTTSLGVDYNLLFPRTTPFFYINAESNTPAYLLLNLEVVPLGVKFDLSPHPKMLLSTSFGPLVNYRSTKKPDTGENQVAFPLRGSLRLKVGYAGTNWGLSDLFEFLPVFKSNLGDPSDATVGTVARNVLALEVKLSQRFSLKEEFKYTYDPALKDQTTESLCADASTHTLMCEKMSIVTTTTLSFRFDLKR